MPKSTKSSASSATRKKKAQKAAKKGGQDVSTNGTQTQPSQRGQKKVKGKGKEPKKKVYIPPQKPKQDNIDPLDSLGLASLLPSDLVILLRKAGKKDVVTRSRALEGLIEWIQVQGNDEEEYKESSLVLAIPCWSHLFPRLSISPNRRLRQLTSQLNALLLSKHTFFDELLSQSEHLEAIIGSMLILAFDPDRQVARISKTTWDQHTDWNDAPEKLHLKDYVEVLIAHISIIIFHKSDEVVPQIANAVVSSTRDAKNRDDVNVEEDVEGTDARLVYSALGALSWLISSQPEPIEVDLYDDLITSSTLWTSLSSHAIPNQRCLGSLSPIVRNAAWQLIRTIVVKWEGILGKMIPIFGFTALQSAFEESDVGVAAHMREGLILLLKARPELWKEREEGGNDDDDIDDEDNDNDEDDVNEEESGSEGADHHTPPAIDTQDQTADYPLYGLFSEWLSSVLRGAYSNYSIVNLLISSMPSEVYPPDSTSALSFLSAMYRPIDERTIEGREALRYFVPAFLECFSWSCARINHLSNKQEAMTLAKDVDVFYTDFIGSVDSTSTSGQQGRIASLGEDRLVMEMAIFLRRLSNIDITLASPLLTLIRSTLSNTVTQSSPALMKRNVDILQAVALSPLKVSIPVSLRRAVFEIISDLSITTANVVASGGMQVEGIHLLTRLMQAIPDAQGKDSLPVLELVFRLLQQGKVNIPQEDHAQFFAAYISCIQDKSSRGKAWTLLLGSFYTHDQVDWLTLGSLMTAMKGKEDLVNGAEKSNLDMAVQNHFLENKDIVRRLIVQPRPYIQTETVQILLDQIAAKGDSKSMLLLDAWLQADSSHSARLFSQDNLKTVVPKVVYSALLQHEPDAIAVWNRIQHEQGANDMAVEVLRKQILAVDEPLEVVLAAARSLTSTTTLIDLVPDKDILDQLLKEACSVQEVTQLVVLDPLVSTETGRPLQSNYDKAGLSSYCRCTITLLEALEETGTKPAWTLTHLISLAIASEDAASFPGAGASHFTSHASFESLANRAVRAATSILSSTASRLDQSWFGDLVKTLESKLQSSDLDELQATLLYLWNIPHGARILSRLLKGLLNFSGAGEKEAVFLLRLAQGSQETKPEQASAIYISVKELVLASPVYDRIRNELAARLAGIPASKAAEEGVKVLRLLVDVAPPTESFVPFIPQQRCMFLLQTLQKWIASDESDLFPPEMHSLLMQLLHHLLPIVQDIPGSHLPFICDLLDVNLSSGMEDIVCVYHTLHLVDLFSTLAKRNATLRETWNESKMDIFENIHDLFLQVSKPAEGNQVRYLVDEALVEVVRAAPESMFTSEKDVAPLFALLQSGNTQFQILAYRLLSNSIRESVQELAVEVALAGQGAGEGEVTERVPLRQVKIADEILSALTEQQIEEGKEYALLLAWLTVFEHFEESSLQLKSIYTSQLQSLGVVERNLLPLFFSQTELNFDPGRWALDEVYLDEMEPSQASMKVLTAHVFYRSLIHIPNLVRESFNSLKDRQQSLYLRNFIMRHLTPLLSHREFSHLRDKATIERISDENMSIKVLAGSNEVIATYIVDEYPLEISIGMPNDYPLRNVEIKDLKKIGVSEGTWRAWILSIRQLIAGRNGLIFDALMLFKRNVEAKFSGFDEDSTCAVCYSIVSPTDHSLPTKPCKTCKKKFHASCLYKWVSTSGSSTCPLCRSIL